MMRNVTYRQKVEQEQRGEHKEEESALGEVRFHESDSSFPKQQQISVPESPVERFTNAHSVYRPDLTWIFLLDGHD